MAISSDNRTIVDGARRRLVLEAMRREARRQMVLDAAAFAAAALFIVWLVLMAGGPQ